MPWWEVPWWKQVNKEEPKPAAEVNPMASASICCGQIQPSSPHHKTWKERFPEESYPGLNSGVVQLCVTSGAITSGMIRFAIASGGL